MKRKDISEIWGRPLRKCDHKIWFFNESGVCEVLSEDAFRHRYQNRMDELHCTLYDWSNLHITADSVFNLDVVDWSQHGMSHFDQSVAMAGSSLVEGDTLEDFFNKVSEKHAYNNMRYDAVIKNGRFHELADGVDRFVTKIERPVFMRIPENDNKHTFDIIKVFVNTCTTWDTDRHKYFQDNLEIICQNVISKIENSQSFKKYGVPTGCLALTDIVTIGDASYQFTFELKKELRALAETEV